MIATGTEDQPAAVLPVQPTKKPRNGAQAAVPYALADVALIDAPTCAAVGGMSVSWWQAEVRAGRAPVPDIREQRCTRWKLTSVREFWQQRVLAAAKNTDAAAAVTEKNKRASVAAQAKRRANAAAQVGA